MSEFVPPVNSPPIETYVSLVKKDIDTLRTRCLDMPLKHPNLNSQETVALRELVDDPRLTIKPADKGGPIVIMDTSMLITEY